MLEVWLSGAHRLEAMLPVSCHVLLAKAPVGEEVCIRAVCGCHSHVMMEGPVMVKLQKSAVPVGGTEPPPCHPMHAVRQPLVPWRE